MNVNDMDTNADDLSQFNETLDLKGASLIGHLTSGGEAARTMDATALSVSSGPCWWGR